MSLRRNLIGFFVMIFFISGIGLGLLVLDDQNDLSSRADLGTQANLRSALAGERGLENGSVWDGASSGLPVEVRFDNLVWLPPVDKDAVFFHLDSPVTVRFTEGLITPEVLQDLLGEDFVSSSSFEPMDGKIGDWEIGTQAFKFFGQAKTVDVWTNSTGFSLVTVSPNDSFRPDIAELSAGITTNIKVKGLATQDDSARLAALIRPSVVMILNTYCAKLNTTPLMGTVLSGKSYPLCLTQAGSGFFVSQAGYIATNGHVVTNSPETSLIYGVSGGTLDILLVDYFQSFLSLQTGLPVDRLQVEQKVKDAHKSKETTYQMASLVVDLVKKGALKIEDGKNDYYVQLGNTPIQLSKTGVNLGKDIVKADFVGADYQFPDPISGFTTSDVALLKVAGTGYPALPLGKIEEVGVGSDVLVVGFPGVVLGSQNLILDVSANAEPTFTKGVISAFKEAKGNRKKLIQTDASINHGNSGGPAVSSDGHVIGISTYGLVPEDGGGNYNFLRDIDDLKALMLKQNISEEAGETYSLWQSGLDSYWLSYLRPAKADFEKVLQLYPNHPSVDKYLSFAESRQGTPEDKTPRFTRAERKLYQGLSGGTMIFSIIAILILSVSEYIDHKRRSTPVTIPPRPHIPSGPAPTF